MAQSIDIFIRTYFRDFRWLKLSLLSILKFAEGYRRIVIVMPNSSFERLRGHEIPTCARIVMLRCPDYPDDYIGQQITKLSADMFTDAPRIAHVDSDCIFSMPCSLSALLESNGRPVIRILWRSRRPTSDGWRRCIQDFHGEPLPFDVLVPPPFVYSRELYASLRTLCRHRHALALDEWCLARSVDSLSEFALLAAHAWFHHRDEYSWTAADDEVGWPCRAYWSRSPAAPRQRAAIADQLGHAP
jgi:hypothetical protein